MATAPLPRLWLDMHHEITMLAQSCFMVEGERCRLAGLNCLPSGLWDAVVSDGENVEAVPIEAVQFERAKDDGAQASGVAGVRVFRTIIPRDGMREFISGQDSAQLIAMHWTGRALFVTAETIHGRHYLPMSIFKFRPPLWRRPAVPGYFRKD